MNFLRLLPANISFLLLAAHFFRMGWLSVTVLYLLMPALLFIRKAWIVRILQVALILGAIEWGRTVYSFIGIRQMIGQDWLRMALIIGSVALITIISALLFQTKPLKKRYKL